MDLNKYKWSQLNLMKVIYRHVFILAPKNSAFRKTKIFLKQFIAAVSLVLRPSKLRIKKNNNLIVK